MSSFAVVLTAGLGGLLHYLPPALGKEKRKAKKKEARVFVNSR
jgi:hypothetical protein